jgi:hypothetical protein
VHVLSDSISLGPLTYASATLSGFHECSLWFRGWNILTPRGLRPRWPTLSRFPCKATARAMFRVAGAPGLIFIVAKLLRHPTISMPYAHTVNSGLPNLYRSR